MVIPQPKISEYIDQLLQVLERGNPSDRPIAARRLGDLGPQARHTIPQLLQLLPKADEETQIAIETTLYRLGTPPPGSAKLLLNALASPSPLARGYAARMFANRTPPLPAPEVPSLLQRIREFPRDIQQNLLTAIAGLDDGVACAQLMQLALTTQPPFQDDVIFSLYNCTPDARMTPTLIEFFVIAS